MLLHQRPWITSRPKPAAVPTPKITCRASAIAVTTRRPLGIESILVNVSVDRNLEVNH